MSMDAEWQIGTSRKVCAVCRKNFNAGEEYFSGLVETPEGFSRQDYCTGCWGPHRAEFFSFWKARVPLPVEEPSRPKFIGTERMIELFRRLDGETDERRQNFRYVLGLILLRKRRLRLVDVKRSGEGEVLVLRESGAAAVHNLPDPRLTDEEIADLSGQINEVLDVPASAEEEQGE
jgi:hypothetical protein